MSRNAVVMLSLGLVMCLVAGTEASRAGVFRRHVLQDTGDLDTAVQLLQGSGSNITGATIFAPRNEAFRALGLNAQPGDFFNETLANTSAQILSLHVLPDYLLNVTQLPVEGTNITVTSQALAQLIITNVDGTYKIQVAGAGNETQATLTPEPIPFNGNIAYKIDKVLLPATLGASQQAQGDASGSRRSLLSDDDGNKYTKSGDKTKAYHDEDNDGDVDKADKKAAKNSTDLAVFFIKAANISVDNSTIFAPSDKAFATLIKFLNVSKGTPPSAFLQPPFGNFSLAALQYSVVPGRVIKAADIPAGNTTLPTLLGGKDLTVSNPGNGTIYVIGSGNKKAAKVVAADIPFGSNIVHLVSQVLLP